MSQYYEEGYLPQPKDKPLKKGLTHSQKRLFFIIFLISSYFIFKYKDMFLEILNWNIFDFLYYFLVIKAALLLIFCPFFIFRSLRYIKYIRMISDFPTSKVRSASMGLVEIKGRPKRKYNLLAPLSKRPCIYYRVKKYKRIGSGKNPRWRLKETITSDSVPFYIIDETGKALVYPTGAQFVSLRKKVFSKSGGYRDDGMIMTVPYKEKWEEEIILEDKDIYILGWAEYAYKKTPTIKDIRLKILKNLKQNKDELNKYDLNKDGVIDSHEWEKAFNDAEKKAYKQYLESGHKDQEHFVLLEPPFEEFPMLISPTKDEARIIKKFFILFLFNFSLSIILAIVGIIMFFS